jgi:hypothetical protein
MENHPMAKNMGRFDFDGGFLMMAEQHLK